MRALIIFTTLLAFSLSAAAAAAERYPYQSCFEIASEMHGVPVDLLLAVAATESGWDADARSNKNSHGIMQIQWPGTAKDLGAKRVSELYNPCFNIELGARYLKQLLHGSGGNVERALAAYNYGPGRISRSPTLPEGAKNYARKVTSQQTKINNESSDREAALTTARSVVFDSNFHAKRFARTLDRQIKGASFKSQSTADGTYEVLMVIHESGLGPTDVATLETLGWSNLGAP